MGFVPALGCLTMEASIGDARIVYQVAPSSMPSMRRVLRQKPANHSSSKPPLLRVNVAKYSAKGPSEFSKLLTTMKLGHLEVCVCKPLLTNLHVHFGGGYKENL